MKKRIFFIAFAIIQIVLAIYTMVNADTITQKNVEELQQTQESMPTELIQEETQQMMQDMTQMVEDRGAASIRVTSGICVLANIAILIISIKNTILRNKGTIIVSCVLTLLLGANEIAMLLAIIGLVVILALKRVNPEDFPVKKQLPVLEKIETNKREVIIGIVLAVAYFSQFIWKDYLPENEKIYYVTIIAFYLIIITLSILFWKKTIKRDFKALKENFGTYLKYILKNFGLMFLCVLPANIIVMAMTGNVSSANQQNLEALPSWFVVPLAIIYAPIVEETIFRGLIHKGIKNKYLFIIISAISFGLLHTINSEVTLFNIIVGAIPYAVMGGFFARIYSKTENITTSMASHFIMNVLASIITLL